MKFGYHEKTPVSARDRNTFLDAAVEFAREAGTVILPHFRSELAIENKLGDAGYDPVTIADKAAEAIIRAGIEKRFPTHGIFGEELGHQSGAGLTWVIDPIDGTRAFVTGMVHWGVLIALFDGTTPVLGVMYQPFTDELFTGTNDDAGYRRGTLTRAVKVRPCGSVAEAVLASTSPQVFGSAEEQAGFRALRRRARLTRWGGDCYQYCMLAMGYVDVAVEASLQPYDVQALMPIIRGAGGIITSWDGGDASMGGRVIASGDARVHREAMALLRDGMEGKLD
jgi:myo-inositol-1(or 4)-monophosphatase